MQATKTMTGAGETAARNAYRIGINTAVKLRWDAGQIITAFLAALRDANLSTEERAISEAIVLLGYGEYGDGWKLEGDEFI